MRHIVVAPDKFKGTLTAAQAAAHLAAGLERARPGLRVIRLPVADGGDGTVDAAVAAGYQRAEAEVQGPTGELVKAAFAVGDGTVIIESTQAAGLGRLPGNVPAPLAASSGGVGELILAAAALGARRIVLGLGGVASTDGGAGMVTALGARLLDESGAELPPGGAALARLARIDLSGMADLAGIGVVAATDVDNPLLGERGAAAVYAPQKGASAPDVTCLEQGLARWADVAERALDRVSRDDPGAGAAGGLGFAALAFLGATMRPGIEVMLGLHSFAGLAGRSRAGRHRRGRARCPDPARQGPGRGGQRGRRVRPGSAGGRRRRDVLIEPRPAPFGRHRARLRARRHRARPRPLPRAGRPAARGARRARGPRLDQLGWHRCPGAG